MLDWVDIDFVEAGTHHMRFGGSLPEAAQSRISDALPLLMSIKRKAVVGLVDITRVKLARIIDLCAGSAVKTRASAELSASIVIHLQSRRIEISEDELGGLRDAIFAAVLLRVYYEAGGADLSFAELIEEARVRILDELPHAMGYSGSEELECSWMDSHSIVLETQYHSRAAGLPHPDQRHVVEQCAVSLKAA